jgi:Fe-S-cluster containining protein
MTRHADPFADGPRRELLRLYGEADALVQGASCTCTSAVDAAGAFCCHFANIGREPYVTEIELRLVAHAVAARGGLKGRAPGEPRRHLQLADDLRTCPLLSREGRCTIYASRPLGCRTFFCEGHGPPKKEATRKGLLEVARRVADLSERVFPRGEGPRPLGRALGSIAGRRS